MKEDQESLTKILSERIRKNFRRDKMETMKYIHKK